MLKLQKAKKDHVCSMCGKKIPKGDKYWREYIENEYGYAIKDEKQHTNCLDYPVDMNG